MAAATAHAEAPDLLRTTLLFNVASHHVENVVQNDDSEGEVFSLFEAVKAGRITLIDQVVQNMQREYSEEEIASFLSQEDEEGKTPLFYACYFNYQNIILYLLLKGVDAFKADRQGRNCFFILAFKGLTESMNLIRNFLRHTIRKNCMFKLKTAKKHFGFLKSHIHKGELVSPDKTLKTVKANFREFLPLVEKIFVEDYLEKIFLMQDIVITQIDELNRTPIHYSAMAKYTKCGYATKLLLTNDFDKIDGYDEFEKLWDEVQLLELNADRREETRSALNVLDLVKEVLNEEVYNFHIKNYKKKVSMLQKHVINSQDGDGYTPMHLASFYGDFLTVQLLLRLGGDEHIKDAKDNKPVIDYAANKQVRRVLLDLKEAARKGDVESFTSLLNSEDENKLDARTTILTIAPIHNAIQHVHETKNQEILNLIIKCGANLDVNDGSGWTPLHHACQNGDLETVKNLVINEANINSFSNKHFYPIHIAALNNHPEIIDFLVTNGADLECQNDEGCVPLHLAAKKGHVESIEVLLHFGADIYAKDIRSWTALHYASYNGHSLAVNLLCKYDSDFERLRDMKNSQDKTAKEIASNENVRFKFNTLWKAAYDGNLDILRRLHRFGEDVNAQTPIYKLTPLIIATQRHHLLVVKYLLDNGADAGLVDAQNQAAFHYAVAALKLIKLDKTKTMKIIDETKASLNEYTLTKDGLKKYVPDLVAKIEKTYKLFVV